MQNVSGVLRGKPRGDCVQNDREQSRTKKGVTQNFNDKKMHLYNLTIVLRILSISQNILVCDREALVFVVVTFAVYFSLFIS